MKIAIINNLNSGSTGNLSISLTNYLRSQGECVEFYYAYGGKSTVGKCFSNKLFLKLNNSFSLFGSNRYAGIKYPTKKLIKQLVRFKPDLINIQCLNIGSVNLKVFFDYVRKLNIPVIITCHAFFYSTANCGYPVDGCNKYIDYCRRCEHSFFAAKSLFKRTNKNFIQMMSWLSGCNIKFACVSDYVTSITKISPLTRDFDSRTIINGIDTTIFKYSPTLHHDGSNEKIKILFTCSDTKGKLKGFSHFATLLKRFESNPNFEFIFVGKMHVKFDSPNLIDIGLLHSKEEMAKVYQSSDLTIMLSKDETFGMPIAESLCCGTPVAFFMCGGCESITIKKYSGIFKYGDIDSLINYIMNKSYLLFSKSEIAEAAKQKYDRSVVNKEYLKLIYEMVQK